MSQIVPDFIQAMLDRQQPPRSPPLRAAVVLAAGSARRFGSDKLSAPFAGEPLLWHALRTACAAPVEEVVVVCHRALTLPIGLPGAPLTRVELESKALSSSLQAGLAAVTHYDAAFVFLGDMPLVPPAIAAALADAIGSGFAALPRHCGEPGHPVLLSRRSFAGVSSLTGDAGAGAMLRDRDDVVWLDSDDPGVVRDVDRPEDLARLSDTPDR